MTNGPAIENGGRTEGLCVASVFRGLSPATSLENYVENPIGRYLAAPNAAAFWASSVLTGMSFWGHPNDADVELIASAVRAAAWPSACCHALLVDLRRLESLDLRAFDKLWSGLASHFAALGPLVRRRALIAPRGPTGAVVGELFKSLSRDPSIRSFADGAEALVWIEVGDHAFLEELDRLPGIASNHTSMIAEMRGLLDERPTDRAEKVARRFGMSQRTFQRRLRELGTSFQQEVTAAHVRIAKRLMRETDNPLKWIAIESGYASLQHFSSSFRVHVGVSPRRWRSNQDDACRDRSNGSRAQLPGAL
jgi:AraC-like DNA-binding protein